MNCRVYFDRHDQPFGCWKSRAGGNPVTFASRPVKAKSLDPRLRGDDDFKVKK